MAEHLVAPASDRLTRQGEHAGEHVAHRVVPGPLLGPRAVERSGAIVEQRRIGRAQGGRDRAVALVARRADRVVALATAAQPARGVVEHAALHLRRIQRRQPPGCGRHRIGRGQRLHGCRRAAPVPARADRRVRPSPRGNASCAAGRVTRASRRGRTAAAATGGRVRTAPARAASGVAGASRPSVRPNHAANLKPWAAPSATQICSQPGHTIDDEVAICGERVEARRRPRRAESVAQQLGHERPQPVLHAGVRFERPRVRIDLGPPQSSEALIESRCPKTGKP